MIFDYKIDYRKLRGKIIEIFGTQGRFALELGVSENTLSDKLNCKRDFTSKQMIKACELLDISLTEMSEYFFDKSSYTEF